MSLIADSISLVSSGEPRLTDVSCIFRPGEFTVIIGPNGSGKTSLIKVLAGELSPSNGRLLINERRIQQWSVKALARCRAVLPQHAALDFPFLVSEVVALGRSPYPRDNKKDQSLVKQALTTFDLTAFAERPYTSLSGGERQRVHLARVWAQICAFNTRSPSYLLLDEPTAALDLKHQRDLMRLLKLTTQQHPLGVVAALHDLNAAAQYADKIILLNQGKMVASGRPEQVLTHDNIEQVYQVSVDILPYQAKDKQVVAVPWQEQT